jgi:hypothetical protein
MRSSSSSGIAPGSNIASWNLRMSYFAPSTSCARARCAIHRSMQLSNMAQEVVVVFAHLGGELLGVRTQTLTHRALRHAELSHESVDSRRMVFNQRETQLVNLGRLFARGYPGDEGCSVIRFAIRQSPDTRIVRGLLLHLGH